MHRFFAEIVRCPVVRPIFDSLTHFTPFFYVFFFFFFLEPFPKPDSPHMRVGAYPLSTTLLTPLDSTSPSSCTEHALSIHFLFCDLSSLFKIIWPELLYGSMYGCYLLFVGMISYFYDTFWFEGVLPFFDSHSFIFIFWRFLFFSFRECSQAHCFARGSELEYLEAVRACAMRRHLCDLGTCLFNCFFFFFAFFAVGHIYLS